MYPLAPVLPLTGDIVRTGIPLAALLIVATVCLVLGMLAVRGASIARASELVA